MLTMHGTSLTPVNLKQCNIQVVFFQNIVFTHFVTYEHALIVTNIENNKYDLRKSNKEKSVFMFATVTVEIQF